MFAFCVYLFSVNTGEFGRKRRGNDAPILRRGAGGEWREDARRVALEQPGLPKSKFFILKIAPTEVSAKELYKIV